ncbi:O-antigen ligase family protein [bacterium]|nr:O-antigen ligase family protein [bacterium]
MKIISYKPDEINKYYTISGFILFFLGVLIKYPPAYDYTIVKNITGFLFSIFLVVIFITQNKRFSFNKYIFTPFLLFFLWTVISAYTSPFKHGASKQLEEYLLYFTIFLCATNCKIEKNWFNIWILAGVSASILAIFQFFSSLRYPVSTFGNPNFFAGHLMMLISISFSHIFLKENNIEKRLLYTLFFLILLLALILTRSRSAIFATLFGLSTVMFLLNRKGNFIKKWGGYIILLISLLFLFPVIKTWYLTNVRLFLWKGTWQMIKARPIFGWGLGNFVFFYPRFRIKEYFLQSESTPTTTHAHNEYLHLWSEIGIIGLILFLTLLAIIFYSLTKEAKKDDFQKILSFGIVGAIASVILDNIFSTNLRNPSTSMYFWFLIGLVSNMAKQEETDIDISKVLWYTILLLSVIMVVFTSFYRVLPEVYLKRGIWAKEERRDEEAIKNYLVVSSLNPNNYVSRYKLAYVYGETGYLDDAIKVYTEINDKIFPHFAKLDANLGTLYLRKEEYKKALYHYRWQEWFNPYDIDVLCGIASIHFIYTEDINQGVEYLNKVLNLDPQNEYANRIMKMLKDEGKI